MKYTPSFYNIVVHENNKVVYLYNSYSGALAEIERPLYEIIQTAQLDDNSKCKDFDELVQDGFIKPSKLNEFNMLVFNERCAYFDLSKDAVEFVIAPTTNCNLKCKYCFEKNIHTTKSMSDETVIDVIRYVTNYLTDKTKSLHISWFGGEPLLAYRQIKGISNKLIDICRDKNINYSSSIITNGILLDKKTAEELSKTCAVNTVQITIDGTEKIYCQKKHASSQQFQTLLNNIKNSLCYFKVAIRLNCDKNNFGDLMQITKQIYELCDKSPNLSFYLAKIVDYNSRDNMISQEEFDKCRIEFDELLAKLKNEKSIPKIPRYKHSYCTQYRLKNLVIGPEGELYKCEHYVGDTNKVIGDVLQGVYFNENLYKGLENDFSKKCSMCKLFPLCIGGCPSQKKLFNEENMCEISMYYIKKLLSKFII